MNKQMAKLLVASGEELGLDMELREDYSGRGMYGSTTAAVVAGSTAEIVAAAFGAGSAAVTMEEDGKRLDFNTDDLLRLRQDAMGRGIVVY